MSEQSIEHVTTVSAPLADLARGMQMDVLHIQEILTDLSAVQAKDEIESVFASAEQHRRSFQQGIERFKQAAAGDHALQQQLAELAAAIDPFCTAGRNMATA